MKTKLAAMYSIFNGLELLEGSIKQIYNHVDVIVICWQEVSNKGHKSNIVREFIKRYEKDKKVHLLEFKPIKGLGPKENERAKYQLRLEYAKKLKCTHYFTSATDHFYKGEEFIKAKAECFEKGYDVTTTKMYTYYKSPCYRIDPIEAYEMPFICKLYPHTEITTTPYPVHVDPSVRINTREKFHSFPQDKIMMHHFSMVRRDIEDKFRNAASSINWTTEKVEGFVNQFNTFKEFEKIVYFKGSTIKIVTNWFNIHVAPV